MRPLAALFGALIATALAAPAMAEDRGQPGAFDFYVLSLSWSPSYCASAGPRANGQQCGGGRPYGFVVHGLWPQNEWGYPANCRLDAGGSRGGYVPRQIVSSLSDIIPSAGLAAYEWRKHGSCTGLTQRDYFATVRDAYNHVSIPPSLRSVAFDRRVDPMLVEKAFIAANPGMTPAGIAVTCQKNYLQEVRICMGRDMTFRACGEANLNACRSRSVTLPATR